MLFAEVNLEEALEEAQADLDLTADSQAGSVGRRLNDVQSDTGSNEETVGPLPNYFAGVFTPAREVPPP